MNDTNKCIHDIAIAILPKALNEADVPIYISEEGNVQVNSSTIVNTYVRLCEALSHEFTN